MGHEHIPGKPHQHEGGDLDHYHLGGGAVVPVGPEINQWDETLAKENAWQHTTIEALRTKVERMEEVVEAARFVVRARHTQAMNTDAWIDQNLAPALESYDEG